MAGIYIHIPFCKQKCHYCNFFSVASVKHKNEFIEALKKEIVAQKKYLNNEIINTIYFGGGTPSLLSKTEIEDIFSALVQNHNISQTAEITMEANPDDLSAAKIKDLSASMINRLSIGIQSFFEDDLKYLNRVHHAQQAIDSVKASQDAGFGNISIDLIYGIPTLTNEKWIQNLELFFKLNIPHLSAYSLTVEPKTALNVLIQKKKLPGTDELQSIVHFNELIKRTAENEFIHYEISNFSKKGFYSKHNSLYWLGENYLGLGPSAHSFNGTSRQWNVSNISTYIKSNFVENIDYEKEVLTESQKFNEYVMTSLRTCWGCDLLHIENVFGTDKAKYLLKSSQKFMEEKKIIHEKNCLYLTTFGKLYADGIAADLFID